MREKSHQSSTIDETQNVNKKKQWYSQFSAAGTAVTTRENVKFNLNMKF